MPGRHDNNNNILPAVMMMAGLDAGLMHAPNPGAKRQAPRRTTKPARRTRMAKASRRKNRRR